MPPLEIMTDVAGTGSNAVLDYRLKIIRSRPLWRHVRLRLGVRHNLSASFGEQIAYRKGRPLAGIGLMTCGHLDGRVPELGAAGEDAVSLDDGIPKEFP